MTAMREDRPAGPAALTDPLLSFTIPSRHARGRMARLGPVLDRILSAHDYAPELKRLLGEALTLTALLGGLLKGEGSQLTLQAQAQGGAVELLVCDFRDGELRGYVKPGPPAAAELGPAPTLRELLGTGHLAVTFEVTGVQERYQGIVPLEGASLSEAVERYFAQSEQVPTLIRTAVSLDGDHCVAGGLLVQHMAESEEGGERLHARRDQPEWDHISIMAGSVTGAELVSADLAPEQLLWRLFHEEQEVRVQPAVQLSRGCRCTVVHFEEVLARFPKEDRREMQDEKGIILVDCAFCSRQFPIQD
jgi:molecular chaperone Hsp33